MPNNTADALYNRLMTNAQQAEQAQILQRIEARLKLLGGQTIDEVWAGLDDKMKRGLYLRAVDRASFAEIFEFIESDPRMRAMREADKRENEQTRVKNAKVVAKATGMQ